MPEGQVVISGFNTASLWRLRQMFRRAAQRRRPGTRKFIGLLRLRDWLRVLGFELNGGKFGCYAPPFRNEALARALRASWKRPARAGGRSPAASTWCAR